MTDAETTQTEIEKGTGIEMEEETGIITGTEIALETTTAAPVHPHLVEDAPPLGIENAIVVGPRQPGTAIESAKTSATAPSSTTQASSSKAPVPALMDLDPEEGEDVSEADVAMMASMGFGGFGTTKGREVTGNQEGGVFIKKQRTWRQYMNRKGGFNRPLDKIK
ncbi:hypothetical protein FRC04_011070 [Tulasnella sp. 424]|nr:hypothetical protein FRC04_011070 [Tulasnella sp. 424]